MKHEAKTQIDGFNEIEKEIGRLREHAPDPIIEKGRVRRTIDRLQGDGPSGPMPKFQFESKQFETGCPQDPEIDVAVTSIHEGFPALGDGVASGLGVLGCET